MSKFKNIKNNSETFQEGLVTKPNEFIFQRTGKTVKAGEVYTKYFTLNKKEIFLTGLKDTSNSKLIIKNGKDTLINQYAKIVHNSKKPYPQNQPSRPSEDDYRIGSIRRFFSRFGNDTKKPIIEISKDDYENQNPLFIYFETRWRISGLKSDVEFANEGAIRQLQRTYPSISDILFPLQLWKPNLNTPEDVENKLSRLKK